MSFWSIVNAYLDSNGLDLAWLARRAGVSRDTLSSQRTRDTIPRLDTAYALASVMKCSLEYLATGEPGELPEDMDQLTRQICHGVLDLDDDDKGEVLALVKNLQSRRAAKRLERELGADPAV